MFPRQLYRIINRNTLRFYNKKLNHAFASDNARGIAPDILDNIVKCNENVPSIIAYGMPKDDYTISIKEKFIKRFNWPVDTEVFFVGIGTAGNIISIQGLGIYSYESVICSDQAHIFTSECGALEKMAGGIRLVPLQTDPKHAKISPKDLEIYCKENIFLNPKSYDEHSHVARGITLSHPTELGALYTIDELKEIKKIADQYDLFVHMDGARITQALVEDEQLVNVLPHVIDAITFGGTKAGMMYGEALVFFSNGRIPKEYTQRHRHKLIKQNMQLFSKQRFIAAQFEALLDCYPKLATQANNMALSLWEAINELDSKDIFVPDYPETNQIFVHMPTNTASKLQEIYTCYVWSTYDDKSVVRFVTAFNTTAEEISNLVDTIKSC
mmetsp:Transcript_12695/g.19062  ORF Transcript_12695/g.19062 Transcript_12695/m.19062 type:complete len:384 (-) Transcript_12695:2413-3564(-)